MIVSNYTPKFKEKVSKTFQLRCKLYPEYWKVKIYGEICVMSTCEFDKESDLGFLVFIRKSEVGDFVYEALMGPYKIVENEILFDAITSIQVNSITELKNFMTNKLGYNSLIQHFSSLYA